MEPIIDPQDYKNISKIFQENLKKVHAGYAGRFLNITERKDVSDRALDKGYSKGKAFTHWRGLALRKYPVDYVIIQQLLWELKPATVFEMGTHEGGSALWMADTLKMYGCQSHVYTVDIEPETIRPLAKQNENITFIQGDLTKVSGVLPDEMLKKLPHPWFLVEDSHINLVVILDHFHKYLQPGDYMCIEDTWPSQPTVEDTRLDESDQIGVGKMSALREWLKKHPDEYVVDVFYSDFYGYNMTANWNGFLKRVK